MTKCEQLCDFDCHGERKFNTFSDKTNRLSSQERGFKRPIAKYMSRLVTISYMTVQIVGLQSIDSTVSTAGVLFKIYASISVLYMYLIRNVSSYL